MAGEILETLDVDAAPAIAGLKEFTDALNDAAGKWADFQAKMGAGMGGGADKLAASMDAAADKISAAADKAAESLAKIGGSADAASGGVDKLGTSADAAAGGLRDASASADEFAAATDKIAEGSDAAAAGMDRQAASADKASASSDKAAESSAGFGSTAKLALLGVGVAAAYGIDKAMKFNSEMLLLHTQAGVSAKDTQVMSQGVLQISAQTGQSLSDVAESAYHVASNMESMKGATPVKMLQAVKIAAEGASVGHSNLVDTTTALTSVLASGIPGATNYSQAMGALNATVGVGEMNMQQLSEAMGTGVVPVVKGYGLTLKDTGAALATYGDLNIRGAKAGTELRMAVQALAVPAVAGQAELSKLGLSSNSLAKDMQSGGLMKALDDLNGRFVKNGITAKNEGAVITDLFGKKAGSGLALLLENMDRLQSKYPALTKGANDFGAAWKATQESPAQKWKEVTAGLQASAVNFGTTLLPAFTKAAGFADRILADINGTKGAADAIAVAFGAAVAVFTTKKLLSGVESAFTTGEKALGVLGKVGQTIGIPGSDSLANLGKGGTAGAAGASGGLDRVATAGDAAAASLDRVAGAGDKAALGEDAAGAAGGKEAIGEDAAGAGGIGKGGAVGAIGTAAIALVIAGAIDDAIGKGKDHQALGDTNKQSWFNNWDAKDPAQVSTARSAYQNRYIGAASNADPQITPFAAAAGPSTSGIDKARADTLRDMTSIDAAVKVKKPPAVPAPDLSLLAGAKGKAQSDATGITDAIKQAMHNPVKMAAPDLTAVAAARGPAHADGVAVSQGLATGILAGGPQAVSAAHAVASQVEAAMAGALKVQSPSKVTEKIGASTAEGLVVGLEGGTSAVNAAATALGKNAAKAADITTLDSNVTKLLNYAPTGDTGLVKTLKGDQAKLTALANQRAKLEAEITDSQQIAQQAISSSSIMNAATYTPALAASNGPQAASATVSGLQAQAADAKQFASEIAQLQKAGLNSTSLNQLTQGGASSGIPVAQGLLQGGKGAISQANAAEAQIIASAKKLGDAGAPAMYEAGVTAGQGLAKGIESQLGSVDSAIKQLANQMVTDMKQALKSHSPSLVFADIGMSVPQGVAQGVDRGTPLAVGAVGRMASGMTGGYHPGSYGHGAGYGGGGSGGSSGGNTTHVTVNMTVQGSVSTQNDLVAAVKNTLLKQGSNNWQAGLVLPGRRN